MDITYFREQRIMLLARMNLGIGSKDKKEITLYKHFRQINESQTKKGIDQRQKM